MIEPRKSIACCDRLDEFAGSRDAPSFLKDTETPNKDVCLRVLAEYVNA
jgi:hypothetical protein